MSPLPGPRHLQSLAVNQARGGGRDARGCGVAQIDGLEVELAVPLDKGGEIEVVWKGKHLRGRAIDSWRTIEEEEQQLNWKRR